MLGLVWDFNNGLIINYGWKVSSSTIILTQLPTAFTEDKYQVIIGVAGNNVSMSCSTFIQSQYYPKQLTAFYSAVSNGNSSFFCPWIAIGY